MCDLSKIEKCLQKPLSKKELRALADENGYINVVIVVDFVDLIENDIEGMNDFVDEKVLGDFGSLLDISYKVVGVCDKDGGIYLEIHADASDAMRTWMPQD